MNEQMEESPFDQFMKRCIRKWGSRQALSPRPGIQRGTHQFTAEVSRNEVTYTLTIAEETQTLTGIVSDSFAELLGVAAEVPNCRLTARDEMLVIRADGM